MSASLADRVILVTGATRGIGRAAALALSQAGAQVIAVGRTQGALEDLDDEARAVGGPPVTLVPLDLTDGQTIDALGYEVFQRHKRLDGLVHAAALLGGHRPVAHIPPDLWDKLLTTNVTAAYRLIRAFEPLMRAAPAARAVFLTAPVAAEPKAFWGGYGAGKAAMETLVRAWADEVDSTPIRAVLLDPGPTRTRLRAEGFPGDDPEPLNNPSDLGPLFVDLMAAAAPPPVSAVLSYRAWANARRAGAPGTP